MKVRRTLVSVLIALTAAVIAIVGAAAILGCAKDKLGTPQDVVVDDYEILRWSKVEGAEKYAVKINDVYYEAQRLLGRRHSVGDRGKGGNSERSRRKTHSRLYRVRL